MANLTEKQKRFCEAYLRNNCVNATKAAIDAGYSKNSAKQQAHLLMSKPEVKQYIDERRADITEETNITVSQRLKLLIKIADMGMEMDPNGKRQGLGASIRAVEVINSMIGIKDNQDEDDLLGSLVNIGVEDCSLPDENYEEDYE